jgi:hypothetical protein
MLGTLRTGIFSESARIGQIQAMSPGLVLGFRALADENFVSRHPKKFVMICTNSRINGKQFDPLVRMRKEQNPFFVKDSAIRACTLPANASESLK